MTRVLQLTDPRAEDVRLAGRPMATLARLAGEGLPVPPGFVVTTECGEWADPEAEAAVYRAYHALGDGRGGLPTVCTIASPQSEDDAPSGEGSPTAQQSLSTVDELLAGIDACRGGARHDQGRPYYPGPPATFMAVGVLQLGTAGLTGAVAIRRLGADSGEADEAEAYEAYEAQHLWSTGNTPLDDAVKLAALDLGRRVGAALRSDTTVEWALIDGHPVVVRARCLASGAALSP